MFPDKKTESEITKLKQHFGRNNEIKGARIKRNAYRVTKKERERERKNARKHGKLGSLNERENPGTIAHGTIAVESRKAVFNYASSSTFRRN